MFETIEYHIADEGYALISLNRVEARNAISFQMTEELKEALQQAREADIKCLVLTGNGTEAFCSGGDLNDFHWDMSDNEAFKALYSMKEVLYDLARFPVPTLAVLNGSALGGGCELATACDFRYGSPDGSYGFIQGQLGITAGFGGGSLLYRRLPSLIAYQMLVESEAYSATKCVSIGWMQDVFDPSDIKEEMKRLLEPFISKSVEQLKEFKQQYIRFEFPISLSADMDEEVRRCSTIWGNALHKEVVDSFLSEKNS
ncbi:enoyl-CoA hydratase/isomerase family protein [Pontibacillus salicampi]|uniref:Ethylmalonyl-CoA decarboxylase n=1 Tax=Pontibacillus salicampi TaxID=1449801 RepID=A0ABV6LNP5_9BACI